MAAHTRPPVEAPDIPLHAGTEAEQAIGEQAGAIVHDLNNLLTAILGAADDALHRPSLDPTLHDDLQLILSSAQRGAVLAGRLLTSDKQRAPTQIVQVNQAVQGIASLLRRALGQHVQLELALKEPGCLIRIDPAQLERALLNLAVNAREAMPDGGQLTVRTGHLALPEPRLHGAERIEPGRYATIEVADTGVGIPPDILPRIFDTYFTTRRGGAGLGLASVRGVVRQSAGFVSVETRPGQGTQFRIHLPSHEPRCLAAPPPTRRVLLVDDEDAVRRFAERALTQRGWVVLAAATAEEALERVAGLSGADQPAVVVSDVVMPGMGGAVLIRLLREARPGLPAILTSGYASDASRAAAEEGIAFLAKPYAASALAALIDAAVGQST